MDRAMKEYCKCSDVIDKLHEFIDLQLRSGEHLLPGENKLAEAVGTSRTTLRKAMKTIEKEGLIKNDARGKIINRKRAPKRKGSICFIGRGRGWLVLHAWNRLWLALSSRAAASGWDCQLKMYMPDSPFSAADIEAFDFIVYTDVGGDCNQGFQKFAKSRNNVIGMQEEHAEFIKHVVCLDNKEAGRMAAQILLNAGYRKPAFLSQDNGYLGFIRREEGFLEELKKKLPAYQAPCLHIYGASASKYLRDYLDKMEEVCALDIDSLFVASDGVIEVAYDPVSTIKKVPENFGLITLAGSYESIVHQPPITAISHGSNAVAQETLNLIEKIASGKQPDKPSIALIKPSIHEGSTIRKPEEG